MVLLLRDRLRGGESSTDLRHGHWAPRVGEGRDRCSDRWEGRQAVVVKRQQGEKEEGRVREREEAENERGFEWQRGAALAGA